MAWTAKLTKIVNANGTAKFTVAFTDGTESFERVYSSDNPGPGYIEARVKQEIAHRESLAAYVATLPEGATITPPSDEEPDANEIAALEFFSLLTKLEAINLGVVKGLVPEDDAGLAALTTEVKTKFKPEYIDDPRFQQRGF